MTEPWSRTLGSPLVALVLAALAAAPAAAQTPAPRALTDAECQVLRGRLADHAKLSDGVRRSVAGRTAALPAPAAPPPAPAAAAPAPAGRAGEIRARLDRIRVERQQAEDARIGALARFDFGGVAQSQAQIVTLDGEKARLEQELAALPAAAPAPAPAVAAPAPPPRDVDRLRCGDMQAAHDEAVRIRQKELGAKEGQPGVVPLIPAKGQTPADAAREMAAQMPDVPGGQVGLLDADGNGRIEAFVDMPAPGVHRMYRQRPDGSLAIEVLAAPAAAATYGEIARRLEETSTRQSGRPLADLVATRPAGPVRVTAETPDWAPAWAQWLAGSYAEASRIERPALRSLEYQNLRGEAVRVVEVLAPTGAGVALRRVVSMARGADREQWEETVTTVRPVSFSRAEVELAQAQETRTAAGALVGTRSAAAPARFAVER